MTTNTGWVRTLDGRDVYWQGDGWFYDFRYQGWLYNPDLVTVPQDAPVRAKVEAWGDRMTEKPTGIWWAKAHPQHILAEGGFLNAVAGLFLFVVTWACRGWIVYTAGYILLHVEEIYRLSWYGGSEAYIGADPLFLAVSYLVGAVFAFLVLTIASLNQTQSNALTTAFVAHRLYRHLAEGQSHTSGGHRPPGI